LRSAKTSTVNRGEALVVWISPASAKSAAALGEPRGERREVGLLHRRLVHAGAEEVTDPLPVGVAGGVLGGVLDQGAQQLAVALVDHREGAHPLALVGRQLDLGEPVAARELVEVGTGIGLAVERPVDRGGDRGELEVGALRGVAGNLRGCGEGGSCEE